jgi:biopolymer transport protein ExbD
MAGAAPNGNGMIVGINVTPLVDITLVLLIILIVTAKVLVAPALPLDLPAARKSEEVQVVFSVVMPVKGPVLVDGQPVAGDDQLLARARTAHARDADLRAVIQADGAVPHRQVMHTLDLLRRVGIARVAFGAQPEEGKK